MSHREIPPESTLVPESMCLLNRIVPLELMLQGEVGEVHDIDGRPETVLRLKEMGLREGVRIRMVSPGKPCIVAVGDHRLSYRGDDSAIVLIEVASDSPS